MTATGDDRSVGRDRRADRSRLDRVFGDVLPEVTTDEREPGESASSDEWLRAQRPPHHG